MAVRSSAPDRTPVRVVLISLDGHLAAAAERAAISLKRAMPGLDLKFHAASEWGRSETALDQCKADIAVADIIVASMLFMEDHIRAVLPDLEARRDSCDAFVGCLAASDVVRLTRLGQFDMSRPATGPVALIKRLRGSGDRSRAGAKQMKTLRRLPKLLKYIPGTAQDVRAYFLSMQYWLAGSERNIASLVTYLVNRYAAGPRSHLRGTLSPEPPREFPETGVYHPDIRPRHTVDARALPHARSKRPVIGLLLMRSYTASRDTGHYDGVIRAFEARGFRVIPAYASGLDSREAIETYFLDNGAPRIDALVSLTGFSLVGGPAFNDSDSAVDMLKALDVPYVCAQALEFQSLSEWGQSGRGLTPVETTMMVALPELDGATGPIVFGGRADHGSTCHGCARQCHFDDSHRRMRACPERVERLVTRVEKLVHLKRRGRADRRIAVTLFNFPPNGGGTGTAAHLDVFSSLLHLMQELQTSGYEVDVPGSAEELRRLVVGGNAEDYGTDANVFAHVSAEDHVRREPRLAEIEAQWGPAPGRQQSDGRSIFILGAQFGNVFVGVQPAFGYEGDPMRLLFDKGFAPTHAFSAYYTWLREDFGADAVLHFGTHGALEFMPGKQVGLSGADWPDTLIGDLPNIYFYAANNPSEALLAKRRGSATTVSYLTPALTRAGLYSDLMELKASVDRWRGCDPDEGDARLRLEELIQAQAALLDLATPEPAWGDGARDAIEALRQRLAEIEHTLIPEGLHVAGRGIGETQRREMLAAMPVSDGGEVLPEAAIADLVAGRPTGLVAREHSLTARLPALEHLAGLNAQLQQAPEIEALIHALDGGFIAPVSGGDLIHNPDILPTGRNIHGFDPFRLPSRFACLDGAGQANRLLETYERDSGKFPETIAVVLWGTDNLKSEGAQIAQVLALMGATPRFDSYGRLAGADLIPLDELGRPRIDVMTTLSGIFRDLLPLQTRMIAEAAYAAAVADEPVEQNFIRKHALAYQAEQGGDLETAALRVFSNADGAYGSNVNLLIEEGCWDEEDELADAFSRRKCFAYGRDGKPAQQAGLMTTILGTVDVAYQNLESVEVGLTTIDHYFDTLGGIGRAVMKSRGEEASVYIGDQTRGGGTVRSLADQVALEARTRTLNPKWYEAMLRHGYEGVRQIEAQVTNTMGWSATTQQVAPWIYQRMTEVFVLDESLRERLADLNPKACAKVANRLIEASDRNYWQPDPETLEALKRAGEDLEDRLEGIVAPSGAAA